ncbi:MAG: hypothetical protein HYS81_03450 [Candidatus Aenigmatarchaeota archaeon]|nr:MAG: hypothetical protein HYS81_03450 [Candidatus Aenigmarchaeota archaeon]
MKTFMKNPLPHKGISPVIASIILVLIVISLSGAYLVFTGRLASTQTAAAEQQASQVQKLTTTIFSVGDIAGQSVGIENIGSEDLELNSLRVTLDGATVNYTMDGTIEPGQRGTLTLTGLWMFGPGEHALRVSGAAKSDSTTVRVKPNPDELALDMRFNEGGGTTASDFSENNNDGTLKNGTVWSAGKFGTAVSFDGTDDYVTAADSGLPTGNGALSVEAWIKPSVLSGYIVSYGDGVTNGKWFEIQMHGVYGLVVSFGGSGCDILPSGVSIPTNQWRHVVATKPSGSSVVSFYVDGAFVSSASPSSCTINLTPADNLKIGKHPTTGSYFKGLVDEVRIFKATYTPDQLYVLERV